jgi:hypothetical protein
MDLTANYTIRFTAVDASTGATVTGVNVSNAILLVENVAGGSDADLAAGPFMLVPGPEA